MDLAREELIVSRLKEVLGGFGEDKNRIEFWNGVAHETRVIRNHQVKSSAEGYYDHAHATSYCSYASCEREVAFSAIGTPPTNPPDWHSQSIFITGLQAEAKLKALIKKAGFYVLESGPYRLEGWVSPQGDDVLVTPDMVLALTRSQRQIFLDRYEFDPGPYVAVEIKSISKYGYGDVLSQSTKLSKPGYYDQAQLEMLGTEAEACIVIYEGKDQRLMEEADPPDPIRVERLFRLHADVNESMDPFTFQQLPLEYLTEYKGGKLPPEGAKTLGDGRENKNGQVYGWDIIVGQKLPWACGYCAWRTRCWAPMEFDVEYVSGKKTYIAKETEF